MTREQAKKLAPFIQAYGDGKTIQVLRQAYGSKNWIEVNDPDWDGSEYRIKPEPRVFWINIRPDKNSSTLLHSTESEARKYTTGNDETIKVMEVLQ
jgi:hypothetical protein